MSVILRSLVFTIRNYFGLGMFIWHKRMLADEFYMARYKDFFLKELAQYIGYRSGWVRRDYLDAGWKGVMTQHYLFFYFQNVS